MSDEESNGSGGIDITLGKLISYPIGLLLILMGLATMLVSIAGGLAVLLAGIITLPLVRSKLRQSQGIDVSRWATVGIVVILVISGTVALAGSVDTGETSNDTDSASVASNAESSSENTDSNSADDDSEQLTHEMGESFVVGENSNSIEYNVQSASSASGVGGDVFSEEADGKYIIIEIQMTNVGDETIDLSTNNFQLVDSQDRQFDVSRVSTALDQDPRIDSDSVVFEQLQPGVTTQGAIAFDVPEGEDEFRLKIEAVGIFSGADDNYVRLEVEEL